MSDLLSVYDVSGRLAYSEQYVRRLLREGQMAGEKIGGAWTIRESALEAYQTGSEPELEPVEDHPLRQRKKGGIRALSFFSGAMGLDLGLERAGIEISLACEFDKACRATIQANRPDIALLSDINDYDAVQIREAAGLGAKEEIHLIAGGPPCQAFSSAGQRKGFDDARGNVFLKYIELGLALRPRYLVIENVRGLLSAALKHRPHDQRGKGFAPLSNDELPGGALAHIIGMLDDAGYGVSFNLYNAANFGSPQTRERVILIAARGGRILPFLAPTHSDQGQHGLPRWRTFRQTVKGMTKVEHDFVRFPEKRLKYYRMLEAGQNWRDLPPKLQKEALGNSYFAGGGKTGFLRRLAWDKPAPTLVTHPAMPATDLCHPVEDRPLSVQEYARLQEFPDTWHFRGSLLERYRQIGNAVPAGLGHALGKLVKDALADSPIEATTPFRYSRYRGTDHVSWREAMKKQAASFGFSN
ncbi:DNA cytosine methyltransferase [Lysobacter sp. A289]